MYAAIGSQPVDCRLQLCLRPGKLVHAAQTKRDVLVAPGEQKNVPVGLQGRKALLEQDKSLPFSVEVAKGAPNKQAGTRGFKVIRTVQAGVDFEGLRGFFQGSWMIGIEVQAPDFFDQRLRHERIGPGGFGGLRSGFFRKKQQNGCKVEQGAKQRKDAAQSIHIFL